VIMMSRNVWENPKTPKPQNPKTPKPLIIEKHSYYYLQS
jgi:hypothetical protein